MANNQNMESGDIVGDQESPDQRASGHFGNSMRNTSKSSKKQTRSSSIMNHARNVKHPQSNNVASFSAKLMQMSNDYQTQGPVSHLRNGTDINPTTYYSNEMSQDEGAIEGANQKAMAQSTKRHKNLRPILQQQTVTQGKHSTLMQGSASYNNIINFKMKRRSIGSMQMGGAYDPNLILHDSSPTVCSYQYGSSDVLATPKEIAENNQFSRYAQVLLNPIAVIDNRSF